MSKRKAEDSSWRLGILFVLLYGTFAQSSARADDANERKDALASHLIKVAIVQFDAVPEAIEQNVASMERLAGEAAQSGARWVVFHEGTVCDYTDKLDQLAELVPEGQSTQRMIALAHKLNCFISFGLSEKESMPGGDRYYISQVFVGPEGFIYKYRKTWLFKDPNDIGFRNEQARYDPGDGPEIFEIDGVRATCFICADGTAPRCVSRAKALQPQIVFNPINVVTGDATMLRAVSGRNAKTIGVPLLMPNRIGASWKFRIGAGAAAVFNGDGTVLAGANGEGKEEVLMATVEIPAK